MLPEQMLRAPLPQFGNPNVGGCTDTFCLSDLPKGNCCTVLAAQEVGACTDKSGTQGHCCTGYVTDKCNGGGCECVVDPSTSCTQDWCYKQKKNGEYTGECLDSCTGNADTCTTNLWPSCFEKDGKTVKKCTNKRGNIVNHVGCECPPQGGTWQCKNGEWECHDCTGKVVTKESGKATDCPAKPSSSCTCKMIEGLQLKKNAQEDQNINAKQVKPGGDGYLIVRRCKNGDVYLLTHDDPVDWTCKGNCPGCWSITTNGILTTKNPEQTNVHCPDCNQGLGYGGNRVLPSFKKYTPSELETLCKNGSTANVWWLFYNASSNGYDDAGEANKMTNSLGAGSPVVVMSKKFPALAIHSMTTSNATPYANVECSNRLMVLTNCTLGESGLYGTKYNPAMSWQWFSLLTRGGQNVSHCVDSYKDGAVVLPVDNECFNVGGDTPGWPSTEAVNNNSKTGSAACFRNDMSLHQDNTLTTIHETCPKICLDPNKKAGETWSEPTDFLYTNTIYKWFNSPTSYEGCQNICTPVPDYTDRNACKAGTDVSHENLWYLSDAVPLLNGDLAPATDNPGFGSSDIMFFSMEDLICSSTTDDCGGSKCPPDNPKDGYTYKCENCTCIATDKGCASDSDCSDGKVCNYAKQCVTPGVKNLYNVIFIIAVVALLIYLFVNI